MIKTSSMKKSDVELCERQRPIQRELSGRVIFVRVACADIIMFSKGRRRPKHSREQCQTVLLCISLLVFQWDATMNFWVHQRCNFRVFVQGYAESKRMRCFESDIMIVVLYCTVNNSISAGRINYSVVHIVVYLRYVLFHSSGLTSALWLLQ